MNQRGMPRVTVLMCVFNGEKYIKQAINSIMNQTFRDFELLVIDDGSTDHTVDYLLGYGDRIRLIRGNHKGLVISLNQGINLAHGEYIARMDRYARLAAQELAKAGRRPLPGELFFRPFFSFLHLYFIRRGFLEGATGYDLAVLMSMYKFLKYYYLRELSRGRDLDGH